MTIKELEEANQQSSGWLYDFIFLAAARAHLETLKEKE